MSITSILILILVLIGYFAIQPRIVQKKSRNEPVGIETAWLWIIAAIAIWLVLMQIAPFL